MIEVADVTAGITATAVFFCNVTGASGADNIGYLWTQTLNGVFPVERFPAVIYENRVLDFRTSTLMIPNLSGLEQNYDYSCTVSIGGMEIGSGTGTLTSPGVYSGLLACFVDNNVHITDTLTLSLPPPLSLSHFSLYLSLSVGPMILVGPDDQELQAGERLVLNCVGQNNEDATMPLRVNWFFTSFDSQFPQRLYNSTDPRVDESRLPDNITVNSTFVIDPVMATDGGVYGCQVSNRDGILPVEQNATVNVLCKYYTMVWLELVSIGWAWF